MGNYIVNEQIDFHTLLRENNWYICRNQVPLNTGVYRFS